MKKKLLKPNELARKSKEMNGRLPSQYTNTDYGKKRKAHNHKFSVKSTKTGQTYWIAAIAENDKLSFSQFLLTEESNTKIIDKLTELPQTIIGEIKKLIKHGAKDLAQNWESALELCNTAYKVANVKLPTPTYKEAWKQYTELLKYTVNTLADYRGLDGEWRQTNTLIRESKHQDFAALNEGIGGRRFFVKIPGQASVELEGDNMTEVMRELINKFKRHGASIDVVHKSKEGAILHVIKKGVPVEEIILQEIS